MSRSMVRPLTLGLGLMVLGAAEAGARHPLDPLSAEEIEKAVAILRDAGHVDAATRFPIIALHPPPKDEIRGGANGEAGPRAAAAVVRQGAEVFEALVDLDGGSVTAYKAVPGAQSAVLFEEWATAQETALADPRFQAALAERGVTDTEAVFCAPFSMGYFGIPEHEGLRLLKVGCFDLRPSTNNMFGWPIEGLYAVVDLVAGEVRELHDSGPVPISTAELNFTESAAGPLRDPLLPVVLASPAGQNVALDGHTVTWQHWRFHVAMDRRVGLVVSDVHYEDRGRWRPILDQAYLAEMFVPYMDPDYGWYSRTYFDTGEYGAGLLATTLQAGIDCPETALFMSAVMNDDEGGAFETPNAVCIFERALGEPVWRHAEALNGTYEGRPAVELVVRFIPTIGNYDYIVDYVFNLAGEIDARVGATGIDALKGVASASMADPTAAEDTRYGTLVAPNLAAIHHDHYFSFRLDMAVDGPSNTLVRDTYKKQRLDGARRSIYVVETEPVTVEGGFELGHAPAKWRVLSAQDTNAVGNPTSYELVHHAHTTLLMDPDDWPARRGAFAAKHLWVTPYDPHQRYPSGDYVFGATGDDGLAVWTEARRPVADTDLVLWVTVGMNHLTRAEDIPVMPTLWHGFKLRPFNFFDRNPALDLPARFAAN